MNTIFMNKPTISKKTCRLPLFPLIGLVFFNSQSVLAAKGAVVKQTATMTSANPNDKQELKFAATTSQEWLVTDQKFRLDIKTTEGSGIFLFNGRNFYVCRQFEAKQVEEITRLNKALGEHADKLKKGVCQIAPTNFVARFFISPAAAVDGTDRSDGMQLTLSVPVFSIKPSSDKPQTIAGKSCASFERGFQIKKEGGVTTQVNGVTMPSDYSVEETMCVADEMVWRKTFGREVMRLVMQQPQSGPILQRMRQVQEKGAGFVLASTATVKVKDSSGDHTFRRELKTDSLALDQEIDDLQLALPKGYELFDPSMLLSSVAPKAANAPAQAQVAAGQTGEDKNPAEAKGDKSLRETLQTAFFSVLSYGLAPN